MRGITEVAKSSRSVSYEPCIVLSERSQRLHKHPPINPSRLPYPPPSRTDLPFSSGRQTYDDVYVRVRNVMGPRVAPKGASIAQIAVKFGGASAERSNALLHKYQVCVCERESVFCIQIVV